MTRDREHDTLSTQRSHHADDTALAPGKRTLTETIHRKAARDANGVAANADVAVAQASGGSGSSLPATLMRKFESSLGVDLSSVRVHTGGASADAAQAVGARAYAIGQDIHFGAGHFDPGSSAGEHLLAHEVAHTVQQRGGAPTRQNKLDVSSPGDGAELEADRAADAMTRGESFGIGGGGGGLSRSPEKIARDPITLPEVVIVGDPNVIELDEVQIGPDKPQNVIQLDEVQIGPDVIQLDEVQIEGTDTGPANANKMAENADKAEEKAHERAKGAGSVIGDVGAVTVMDKEDADRLIALINGDAGKLDGGIANGDIKSNVRESNQQAVSALSVYSETLGNDKFNVDTFQQQSQILGADFARLHAQMLTFDKSGQAGGAITNVAEKMPAGENRGKRLGETVIDSASGQSVATLNQDFKKTMTAADGAQGHSTNATAHRNAAEQTKKDMDSAQTAVSRGARDIMPKTASAAAQVANLKAMAAGADVGKLQGEIDKITKDAAAAEEKVKLAGGIIKNVVGAGFAAVGDPKGPNVGAIVGAALDIVTNIAAYTVKHFDDSTVEDKEEKKKIASANQIFQRSQEAAKQAQRTLGELKNTATSFYENVENLAKAKKNYRDQMKLMGNSLDEAQGGNAFSVITQVLAEAEAYLSQSKVTIETGRNAVGKLPASQGGPRIDQGTTGSVTYYLAVEPPDKHTFFASRGSFTMKGSLTQKADNVLGDEIDKVIAQLEKENDEIEGLAKSLRGVFKA